MFSTGKKLLSENCHCDDPYRLERIELLARRMANNSEKALKEAETMNRHLLWIKIINGITIVYLILK